MINILINTFYKDIDSIHADLCQPAVDKQDDKNT